MKNAMPDLSDLAAPGTTIAVRVTPNAAKNAVLRDGPVIRVTVTCVPEAGKANAAAAKLLARALGLPKSRLTLIRGATARDKLFAVS
ncbi:MAG: DUF167 family protein [Rhodobacter sp.]|jgi:hypothetical protein|nr:DUF167 family protein [Rhodobacter sp.]